MPGALPRLHPKANLKLQSGCGRARDCQSYSIHLLPRRSSLLSILLSLAHCRFTTTTSSGLIVRFFFLHGDVKGLVIDPADSGSCTQRPKDDRDGESAWIKIKKRFLLILLRFFWYVAGIREIVQRLRSAGMMEEMSSETRRTSDDEAHPEQLTATCVQRGREAASVCRENKAARVCLFIDTLSFGLPLTEFSSDTIQSLFLLFADRSLSPSKKKVPCLYASKLRYSDCVVLQRSQCTATTTMLVVADRCIFISLLPFVASRWEEPAV